MKKKCGYSNYIVLQCKNMECGWKYSFNSSRKQGRSYEGRVSDGRVSDACMYFQYFA